MEKSKTSAEIFYEENILPGINNLPREMLRNVLYYEFVDEDIEIIIKNLLTVISMLIKEKEEIEMDKLSEFVIFMNIGEIKKYLRSAVGTNKKKITQLINKNKEGETGKRYHDMMSIIKELPGKLEKVLNSKDFSVLNRDFDEEIRLITNDILTSLLFLKSEVKNPNIFNENLDEILKLAEETRKLLHEKVKHPEIKEVDYF